MLTETFSSFWNNLPHTKKLENKENRPKIIGRDKSEHVNSENSRETIWFSEKNWKVYSVAEKKISKFLGHLPSEQIFYRNIPLAAPVSWFNGNERISSRKSSIPLYLIFTGFTLFYRRPVLSCILYLFF